MLSAHQLICSCLAAGENIIAVQLAATATLGASGVIATSVVAAAAAVGAMKIRPVLWYVRLPLLLPGRSVSIIISVC